LDRLVKAVVVQDGARMHYGLPIALARAGYLECMFTDFFAAPGTFAELCARLASRIRPALGRRMALRYCDELPRDRIRVNLPLALGQQLARIGALCIEDYFRRCTDLTGRWIRRAGVDGANALVGFVRHVDPYLCRFARRQGLTVVGDQIIAPALVENREHRMQAERWPGWEPASRASPVRALEQQTWAECDHLTAPSEYVKAGLVEDGNDPDKVSVIPYPVPPDWFRPANRTQRTGRLTVGFVGAVNLRKGTPYFFETARRLSADRFRFVMIGPICLNEPAVAAHRGSVELLGNKSRQEVARLLDEMDIFYFPSTCEGSAGSVMEAMMAGLPVICSPNTGSVIRDGTDGFVIPFDDTELAAERLSRLANDRELRLEVGRSARERAKSFDVEFYSRSWAALLTRLLTERS
jgi:glycosyltransferase involved in cell wall biosynthesis